MIGKTVGKYRFVEKLGRGGMGTVYKAVDESLDREVAIKILNPDLTDSDLMKRFRMEASTLARLHHPAIATIYELHRNDDDLLMVMEFVRGESLDQLAMRCGQLPPERAAYLLAQVLNAIGHAHAAGIIHRDLKPSNVMVTEEGTAKILDFGIARVRGTEHMTSAGFMMGTPAYMSPEQVLSQEVDGRSDLYAIGVMFYRLLTGRLPFEADTAIGVIHKQVADMPTPARLHRAELPSWTLEILSRALAKAPDDRYQTAEEFRNALIDGIQAAGATDSTMLLSPDSLTPPPIAARRGADALAGTIAAPPAMTSAPTPGVTRVATPTPVATRATTPTPVATRVTTPAPIATRTVPALPPLTPPAKPPAAAHAPAPPKAAAPKPPSNPIAPKQVSAKAGNASTPLKNRRNTFALAAALVALVAIAVTLAGLFAVRRSRAENLAAAAAADAARSTPAPDPTPAAVAVLPATPIPDLALPPLSVAPPPDATAAPVAATEPVAAPAPTAPTATSGMTAPARPARAARGAVAPAARVEERAPVAVVERAPAPEAPAPVAPAPKAIVAPMTFAAKALVKDGDKPRERDASVRLADGQVTVIGQDRTILSTLAFDTVQSVIYSKSKQPLWNAPAGATPIERVEAGAFGFMKVRHWVSLRTKERFVVMRIEESQVSDVLSALEERTGKTTVRLEEPKGR